jgi:hypothetical protein
VRQRDINRRTILDANVFKGLAGVLLVETEKFTWPDVGIVTFDHNLGDCPEIENGRRRHCRDGRKFDYRVLARTLL